MRKLYVVFYFIFFAFYLSAQEAVESFIRASCFSNANISLLLKEIDSEKIIMSHRQDNLTVPASTAKLITTATALELLDGDFVFETKLQYDGEIRHGELHGNIYILGSGDPTLGSTYMGDTAFFKKWIDAVKQLGIKKITGAIIADASIFSTEGISPKWLWEDMGNYYAAGAYGISMYDNTYTLTFKTSDVGTIPQLVSINPEIPGLTFSLQLKAANNQKDSAYIYGAPFCNERFVYGSIPANKALFSIKGDIPNPPLYAAQLFTQKLQANGIEISNPPLALFENKNIERKEFFVEVSPPLANIIANINQRSNNHYAEHLFRYIGLDNSKQAGIAASMQAIKAFWLARGLDVSGLVLYDGSGLSPVNGVSAQFLVELLSYQYKSSISNEDFFNSLPIAGESGTVKNFLKNTRLKGKVYVKSGSLYRTQCYAGYLSDKDDKWYAFAILINNYSGPRTNVLNEIEKLLLSVGK